MKNIRDKFEKIITIENYMEDVNRCIENKLYLPGLITALTIPDLCYKFENKSESKAYYIEWFNKWVYSKTYNLPSDEYCASDKAFGDVHKIKFDGELCYYLRCSLIHSGNNKIEDNKSYKYENVRANSIELCINSSSNYQYGEGSFLTTNMSNGTQFKELRINIITLMKRLLDGCTDFLNSNPQYKEKELFKYIDWDKNKNNMQ